MKLSTVSLLLMAAFAAVPPAASTAYTQPAATLGAAGGLSASASHTNLGTLGQPVIVGEGGSASYRAGHGFIPVLGHWRLLYPVISATPESLSFILTSDTQPLTVANAGSETLRWSVTKIGPAENWLSFSPATGTEQGVISVTATAAGLAPGVYHEILTISGAGIIDSVTISVTLTVNATKYYKLTLALWSDTPGKGGGSVHSDPGGIACTVSGRNSSGVCSADFPDGTVLNLMQTPDSDSTWATWSAAGCGASQNCHMVMNGDRNVTATFPYSAMARVFSTGSGYESLIAAYGNAGATDSVYSRAVTFTEDLTLGSGKLITLLGGRDAWYDPRNDVTTLKGQLTIRSGSLTVERLVIR